MNHENDSDDRGSGKNPTFPPGTAVPSIPQPISPSDGGGMRPAPADPRPDNSPHRSDP